MLSGMPPCLRFAFEPLIRCMEMSGQIIISTTCNAGLEAGHAETSDGKNQKIWVAWTVLMDDR